MILRLALIAALSTGCSDPYGDAQTADTIAAWQTFIDENPRNPKRGMGEIRLEELYLEDARTAKTLETYDTYLEKFPKGKFVETATKERREFLMEWARATNTVEAWEQYLEEYPATRSAGGREAKRRLNMAKHQDKIDLGPVKMEQVNLAEDPNGPMNGYGFYVDITNKGDKPISRLNIKIHYLDASGASVGSGSWPVVAQRLPGGLPMAEGFNKPIGPGETRQWEWTDGDFPETWSKKTEVIATSIAFVGE
jgi:hypothetical protein